MEFLSQYDATIHYFPGDKNTVADALSCLPEATLPTIAAIIEAHSRALQPASNLKVHSSPRSDMGMLQTLSQKNFVQPQQGCTTSKPKMVSGLLTTSSCP